MLARLTFAALAAAIFSTLPLPALACHAEGPGCGPSEAQPFDPRVSFTLDDPSAGAHSDVVFGWRHEHAHEQIPGSLDLHLPAGFTVHLHAPAEGTEIGDLEVVLDGGPFTGPTEFTGTVTDANDYEDWPRDGVYRWYGFVEGGGVEYPLDIFATVDPTDGHLHAWTQVSGQLIARAQALDAWLVSAEVRLRGMITSPLVLGVHPPGIADTPFLTNPTEPGLYSGSADFVGWDDPDTPEVPPSASREFQVEVVPASPCLHDDAAIALPICVRG